MIKYYTSYSLLEHNTFGINVKADSFIEFESVEDIEQIVKEKRIGSSFFVIGGGSNLLFMNDYKGTILHSAIKSIELIEENEKNVLVRVGSGVNWDEFVAYTVEKEWQGLENLSAIPGEVGASAVQNVGAYGVEAGNHIEQVETVLLTDGTRRFFTKEDCCFSYRKSIFKEKEKGKHIVAYVTYKLNKQPKYVLGYGNLKERCEMRGGISVMNIRAAVCDIRNEKLPSPSVMGSAGSFFMNPVVDDDFAACLLDMYPNMPVYKTSDGIKLSAGWLIEQCGWKEKSSEKVGVYGKQALVIVNLSNATGKDVMEFASSIQKSVKEKFGVNLIPEVNVIY